MEIKAEFQDPSWCVDIQDCELGPWSILSLSSVAPRYGYIHKLGSYYPSCHQHGTLFLGRDHIDSFTWR